MPRFPAQKGSQRPDFHPSPLFSSDRFHLPLLMSPYRSPSLFTCLLFGWLSRPTHDPRFKVPLADHLADGANARAHTCVVPSFTLFFSRLLRVDCTLHHCTAGPLASLRSVSLRVLARFSATHSSKPKSTVLRERAFFLHLSPPRFIARPCSYLVLTPHGMLACVMRETRTGHRVASRFFLSVCSYDRLELWLSHEYRRDKYWFFRAATTFKPPWDQFYFLLHFVLATRQLFGKRRISNGLLLEFPTLHDLCRLRVKNTNIVSFTRL